MPGDGAEAQPTGGASHEILDHTSEITVRLSAPSYAGLLAEATRAFAALAGTDQVREGGKEWREFRVAAPDRAAQLVGWLNEMVYLAEAEEWMPLELDVSVESDAELRIRARGVDLPEPFVLVKAATFHDAEVHEGPSGFRGQVTLDV